MKHLPKFRQVDPTEEVSFVGIQDIADPLVTTWILEDFPQDGSFQAVKLGVDSYSFAWSEAQRKTNQKALMAACQLALQELFATKEATSIIHYGLAHDFADLDFARSLGFVFEGIERRMVDGTRIDIWRSSRLNCDAAPEAFGRLYADVIDGSTPANLVAQFHRVYDLPNLVADGASASVDHSRIEMRMSLIKEEFAELCGAVYGPAAETLLLQTYESLPDQGLRDVVESADALADLIYVIYGLALESGIDLNYVLAEVHRSNLSKLMPDGTVRRRDDGKVLKGPDFSEPDIAAALSKGNQN